MPQHQDYVRMGEEARAERDRQAREAEEAKTRELEKVAGAAYLEFDELFVADLDHQVKVSRYADATQVLRGETATAGSPAPGVAPTQSASALPFDFDSLPSDKQRIMIMIAQDPQRFREETIGEKVVLKDTHYASARAAIRRQQEAERSQEGGSDGSSSTPAPAAPAKKAAAAKKATPAPPRSGATATEVQPPAPVQPPDAAQAPAPRSTPAPQQAAGTAPNDESEPDSETPSLMDRLKAAGKAAVENAKQ